MMLSTTQVNDADRRVLLGITVLIALVIPFFIASKETLHLQQLGLIVGTLALT